MKRFQITELVDWFSQKEIIKMIKSMKEGDILRIIKLEDTSEIIGKEKSNG